MSDSVATGVDCNTCRSVDLRRVLISGILTFHNHVITDFGLSITDINLRSILVHKEAS